MTLPGVMLLFYELWDKPCQIVRGEGDAASCEASLAEHVFEKIMFD